MDVICSRLDFWDVQEEVLTQSSGQGISAPRTKLSISGLFQEKNKQGDRGNSGKIEGHCKCESVEVCNAP